MQKNEIITLDITDINNLGYGVGRHEGVVVFVAGAVSGDKVKAKIIKVNKNWCVGRLTELLERSPYRTDERFCSAPDSCGGCVYRNITYAHECELKREYVKNAFRKCGIPDADVAEVLTAGEIKGYRNKAQYPVKTENGKMRAGFYAAKTHNIVACENCALQPEIFSEIVRFVCEFSDNNGIKAYDELTGKGLLRHIYLRYAQNTGEIMLCLVINGKKLPDNEKFVRELTERFENVKSVMLSVNTKNTNVVLGEEFECIGGRDYIEDVLCDVRFRISAGSFYQVNHDGAELLYKLAADLAEPEGKTVIDLYCGAGTIGLSMAKRAKRVVGIEIVDEAVKCANINAKINGIENAEFYCGDASDTEGLLEIVEKKSGVKIDSDVVIMDPPRKGSTKELIEYLSNRGITRVVYVSCDPDTLARDCAWFKELGYEMGTVNLVNMFPRTGHVESVVCLSRENKSPFEKLEKTSTPLLYMAAQNSVYGQRYEFESGGITDAMFVYLDGSPSPKSMEALDRNYRLRPLVCLTGTWEEYIKKTFPNAQTYNRYMMRPACRFLTNGKIDLPEGFEVALFDEKAFALHPFSHGENYSSFAAFQEHGAGAVVWHNDKIVASASSFITVNDEIELDVSTEEAYRGKGVASACVSLMLQECAKRGIVVHWDAQNESSLHLAEKFGFEQECAYYVYFLPKRITDESVVCLTRKD